MGEGPSPMSVVSGTGAVSRTDWVDTVTGSVGRYESPGRAEAAMSGDRNHDASAVTPTIAAQVMITTVGPVTSAMGPTMMMGKKLARLTRVLRTPNTRPRTSSGSSSWSAVWAGTAT